MKMDNEYGLELLRKALKGLLPHSAIKDLCSTREELVEYVSIRERALERFSCLGSLWIARQDPDAPWITPDVRESINELALIEESLEKEFEEEINKLYFLIADPVRFSRAKKVDKRNTVHMH